MKGPRTVKVAVRHVRGDAGRRRTRAVTWAARDFQLVRPAVGLDRVELECPVCAVPVLAEVRDHARTRRVRAAWAAAGVLALILCAVSLGYALHEGAGTRPPGQPQAALVPAGVVVAAVLLALALTAFAVRRGHIGVRLLTDGPEPGGGHRVVPVRG
ncbi:hypothetical protein [Streptomyces humi]|uniref:hypothetical protein n=1 Tax=Streptomyces humi TaxID=1428620 RepID=UPI0006288B71|nr:hypothetical protein [Streptomyces humi]